MCGEARGYVCVRALLYVRDISSQTWLADEFRCRSQSGSALWSFIQDRMLCNLGIELNNGFVCEVESAHNFGDGLVAVNFTAFLEIHFELLLGLAVESCCCSRSALSVCGMIEQVSVHHNILFLFLSLFFRNLDVVFGFVSRNLSCIDQRFDQVLLPLHVRPLFFVKHVSHSVNLVQKNFVGVRAKRYILNKVFVKQFFQLIYRNFLFFKNVPKNTQHFRSVGHVAFFGGA